ncbi:hypothetical protein Cni_G24683 [Canna indica]|uniref:Uncharacterized protein n=1 Tax=Canna indica TaxID=4628 RepID=A0AAQ3L2X0_9LILI|nr:hypothetical protein Cni_G24683 [Canna indica]
MVARRAGAAARQVSTATTPKMKPMSQASAEYVEHHQRNKPWETKTEFMPIGVMLGLVVAAVTIGIHTAKQQLVHSPGVRVSKKKRELIPEVEEPDHVAGEADRFVTKSFLRKVAHLQDIDSIRSGPSDPTRPDPFDNQPRGMESLKSVGVKPSGH